MEAEAVQRANAKKKLKEAEKGVVLVVDDNDFFRKMQQLVLEREGFAVVTAADGRQAVDLLCEMEGAIDLVVTDLMMPEMDGIELCRCIRSGGLELPVILVTGSHGQECTERPRDFGFTAAITKPFEPRELIELINDCTGSGEGLFLVPERCSQTGA